MNACLKSLLVALVGLAVSLSSVCERQAMAQRDRFATLRSRMVELYIAAEGVKDKRVLDAMRSTPRHEFVARQHLNQAYFDMALAIGASQTISPPFVVAYMTEQLEPKAEDVVLEIGTGSGYQAAVLSPLVKEVYTIEIVESLGKKAKAKLRNLGYENVHVKVGDGYKGWPEHAPFDKIIVTCSPEDIPQPLVDQLKDGGRMVIPLGERYQQTLYLFTKQDGKLVQEALLPTLFVPMTGAAEEERDVLPDPLNPSLTNGSFEEIVEKNGKPVGWHYTREFEVREDAESPAGERYMAFVNRQAGRFSQALQAFPIDGTKVRQLTLEVTVRGENVRPGTNSFQIAAAAIGFYDRNRRLLGEDPAATWRGSFDWREEKLQVRVPPQAREAILRIGLLGGTGEIHFDNLRLSKSN
ncbi:MAG: protein-L-isoaspartate(D-aspartate) O-methyltransferase [Pirellulales bacterium]|nr:protein-L-isoaspartate(D-aspartate) O-methyltransferase [Pirellulales bacterium]